VSGHVQSVMSLVLCECLSIREKKIPEDWTRFDTQDLYDQKRGHRGIFPESYDKIGFMVDPSREHCGYRAVATHPDRRRSR
jgi:hypothetical protein